MSIVGWSRKKSPWVYHGVCSSCNGCDLELLAALTPKYDVERLGIKMVPSPRHADVLLVSGALNRKNVKRLLQIYSQIPEPKFVVAIGICAISASMYDASYNIHEKLKDKIHVDIFIPGCPPKPEAIIQGISLLTKKIK